MVCKYRKGLKLGADIGKCHVSLVCDDCLPLIEREINILRREYNMPDIKIFRDYGGYMKRKRPDNSEMGIIVL